MIRLEVAVPDGAGNVASTVSVGATGGVASGEVRRYQYLYRDPVSGPCGTGFNLTNGLELVWQP